MKELERRKKAANEVMFLRNSKMSTGCGRHATLAFIRNAQNRHALNTIIVHDVTSEVHFCAILRYSSIAFNG